jgi:hypothetical protein
MIGTTRPRVNFFMNKFKKLGFIKYRGALNAHGGIQINASRLAKALRKQLQLARLGGLKEGKSRYAFRTFQLHHPFICVPAIGKCSNAAFISFLEWLLFWMNTKITQHLVREWLG